MVAVNDRVQVYSSRAGRRVEGKVLAPRPNDLWLVEYDNGEKATKAISDWDVVSTAPIKPAKVKIDEVENVKERSFVVVVNDEELTDFGDDELKANRFALRAYRLGDSAHVYERKLVEVFRLADPE